MQINKTNSGPKYFLGDRCIDYVMLYLQGSQGIRGLKGHKGEKVRDSLQFNTSEYTSLTQEIRSLKSQLHSKERIICTLLVHIQQLLTIAEG